MALFSETVRFAKSAGKESRYFRSAGALPPSK